jgi:hypothetical protein
MAAAQDDDANGAGSQHKRVYQACIPCRRRKVRCDLGSVDNPNDPPCVRCRRESKECYFSATRRKRKTDDGEGSDVDEYIIRNGRKRLNASVGPPPANSPPPPIDRRLYNDIPLTPGGSHGRKEPLRRPDGSFPPGPGSSVPTTARSRRDSELGQDGDDNQQIENPDAQAALRRGVYGTHDALDLLYKAATDTDRFFGPRPSSGSTAVPANDVSPLTTATPSHRREESRASLSVPPPPTSVDPAADRKTPRQYFTPGSRTEQAIDPDLGKQNLATQPGYPQAIKAWARFRFVRAGWFTPQEAVEYID